MRDIRVALGQIAPRLGDIEANLEVHQQAARDAVGTGSDLIVFPELSLTGYLLADLVPDLALPLDDPRLNPLPSSPRRRSHSCTSESTSEPRR